MSDIFKAYVGPEDQRFGIEVWTDGEAALIEITEFTRKLDEERALMLRLDRDELTKVVAALQEALRQVTGDD